MGARGQAPFPTRPAQAAAKFIKPDIVKIKKAAKLLPRGLPAVNRAKCFGYKLYPALSPAWRR